MYKIEVYRSFCNIVGSENSVKTPSNFLARCTIKSVKTFEDVIDICKKYFQSEYGEDTLLAFRGQKYSSWKIKPSIARGTGLEEYEKDILERFIKGQEGKDHDLSVNDIFLAQHYGCATRLLDITIDAKVALWFATEPYYTNYGKMHDGEVIVMPTKTVDRNDSIINFNLWQICNYEKIIGLGKDDVIRDYSKDSCVACDDVLRNFKLPISAIEYSDMIQEESQRIKNQGALGVLVPWQPIESQNRTGCFWSQQYTKGFISIKIDGKSKAAIRESIKEKYNEKTLFPNDLEHLSKHIMSEVSLELKHK